MKQDSQGRSELMQLLDSLHTGRLTALGVERMERLVLSDLQLCRLYLERVWLDADLYTEYAPSHDFGREMSFAAPRTVRTEPASATPVQEDLLNLEVLSRAAHEGAAPIPCFSLDVPTIHTHASSAQSGEKLFGAKTRSAWLVTLLASLIVCGTVALVTWQTRHRAPQADGAKKVADDWSEPITNDPVARLVASTNCKWQKEPEGSALKPGDLRLETGIAELEFNSGTRAFIEGPAEFKLYGPNRLGLHAGRLTANVPFRAIGFAVRTPSAIVVDLGTEFGVHVDRQGKAEVHVLQGAVEVAAVEGGEDSQPLRLTAGHAVQAEVGHSELTEIDLNREPFAGFANVPPPKTSTLRVLAHYRMGEDDDLTQPTVTMAGVGNMSLRASSPLRRVSGGAPGSKSAISFQGDESDRLESESPLPETAEDWLLEVWVRPNNCDDATVVFNGRPDGGLGLFIRDGKWCGALGGGDFVIEKQSTCSAGKWTHLALVQRRDGGTSLWINGRHAVAEFTEGLPTPTTENFCIGGCPASPDDVFIGEVDEVRWSRLMQPFDPAMLLLK